MIPEHIEAAVLVTASRVEMQQKQLDRIEATVQRLADADADTTSRVADVRVELATLTAQAAKHADRAKIAGSIRPWLVAAATAAGIAGGEALRVVCGG